MMFALLFWRLLLFYSFYCTSIHRLSDHQRDAAIIDDWLYLRCLRRTVTGADGSLTPASFCTITRYNESRSVGMSLTTRAVSFAVATGRHPSPMFCSTMNLMSSDRWSLFGSQEMRTASSLRSVADGAICKAEGGLAEIVVHKSIYTYFF